MYRYYSKLFTVLNVLTHLILSSNNHMYLKKKKNGQGKNQSKAVATNETYETLISNFQLLLLLVLGVCNHQTP